MAQKQCFRLLGLLVLLLPIHPHAAHPAAKSVEARPDSDADRAGFIWPVVDIKAPAGTPIRAAAPGTVTFSGRQSSYGRTVKIAHANGLSTVYAHNSANFVKPGDPVKAGTLIGTVGRTGRATTSHVHFEIRRKGVAKNPLPLLQRSQPGPMPATRHEARAAARRQPTSEIKG